MIKREVVANVTVTSLTDTLWKFCLAIICRRVFSGKHNVTHLVDIPMSGIIACLK